MRGGVSGSDGDGVRNTSHVEKETRKGKEVEEMEHGRGDQACP